jgi:endo-1,4-beta-xylanase
MLVYSFLTAVTLAAAGALAAPYRSLQTDQQIQAAQITPNGEGEDNGYYWWWWNDGQADVAKYTNGPKGSFDVEWKGTGNLIGGKGWKVGKARNITYSAEIDRVNNGNSYIAIYGFKESTANIRVPHYEYYILESWGVYNPSAGAVYKGSVTTAGGTYKLYLYIRTPPGMTPATLTYWAIRDEQRTSGTVDVGVFFDAWTELAGMPDAGKDGDQCVVTEAYHSAGKSRVTVTTPP